MTEPRSVEICSSEVFFFADGETVITLFDASATAADGLPYRNTYTRYFWMSDGKATKAVAFFDTREFDEFWQRVTPRSASV